MTVTRADTRGDAAYVTRAHGAYLISNTESGEADGTSTPDQQYDAAGSLKTAKRIARAGAVDFGWRPPFRWTSASPGLWILEGLNNDGYEYEEADSDG